MYLKRLEIVGFKSFADAFELEFQKGISCIVGPNGCGKSNIADAIRWALGSQSPTELRADRMEDVIFSGTVARKPQGMAEVVLTFDNSGRELDLDFDEVSVTRRLFRSGDSEYLLNGNRCRLMDITDLIVDRGLGSNGYWILEKNMTETIIESGPSDRRFLFDEAAGIVKYKMQRHRAELKLNAVAADLDRLDDIITEVERNVGQLKKQVSAYRRWERAERRIREIEGLLDHRSLQESREKLRELEERLGLATAREQKASAAARAASGKQASARVSLEKAQTRLDGEHARVSDLDGEMSRVSRELAVAEERYRNISSRIENSRLESSREKERARELAKEAEELREREKELQRRLKEAGAALEKASAESEEAEKNHAGSAARLEEARSEYAGVSKEEQALQKEYTDSLRSRERAEQELQHALDRKEELERQAAEMSETLETARSELRQAGSRRDGLVGELEQAGKDLDELTSRLRLAGEAVRSLEMDRTVLNARLEGLREAEESSNPADEPLSSRIAVGDGMGIAVGAWLDGFQDAGFHGPSRDIPQGGEGERYFVSVREAVRPEVPSGAVWLPDLLEEGTDPSIYGLMCRAVLAPDRARALEWFFSGWELDIVTAEGDLFRSDGLVRLGVPESGAGAIERRALIEEAEKEFDRLTGELEERRSDREELLVREKEILDAREQLREQLSSADREEASLQAAASAREERLKGLAEEIESIEQKLPRLRESSTRQESAGARARMTGIREKLEKLAADLKRLEERRDSLGAELNSLLRVENTARLEYSSLETSLKRTMDDRERLSESSRGALERSGRIEEEMGELEKERSGLEELMRELRSNLTRLSGLREEAEQRRTDASRERAEWLEKTRKADEELTLQREELSTAREERVTLSGELQMVEEKCSQLEEREPVLPDEGSRYWDYPRERLLGELEKQRGYRENLGPINMLAVTEYEEGMKRIDFLAAQRDDLDRARTSLLEAIEEINRTAARKFERSLSRLRAWFSCACRPVSVSSRRRWWPCSVTEVRSRSASPPSVARSSTSSTAKPSSLSRRSRASIL